MTTYDDMLRAIKDAERLIYDTAIVPPGSTGELPPGKSLFGLRVIESPLASMEVPDGAKLRRAWDQNSGDHYVIEKRTKRVPAAFLIDSRALLDYLRPWEPEPIYKRDLSAFGGYGAIINYTVA